MKVGKLATIQFLTTNKLLKMSVSCLLHELDIIAVHKYICTYRTNHNIHCWCPSGQAGTAPDNCTNRLGPGESRGGGRPRGYLPGAPDEPPSPPAPTRQTGRCQHRVTRSRPPWWTMLTLLHLFAIGFVQYSIIIRRRFRQFVIEQNPSLTLARSGGGVDATPPHEFL